MYVSKHKNYSNSVITVNKRIIACVLVRSLGSEHEGSHRLVLRDSLGEQEPRGERWTELIDVEDRDEHLAVVDVDWTGTTV